MVWGVVGARLLEWCELGEFGGWGLCRGEEGGRVDCVSKAAGRADKGQAGFEETTS